MEVDLELKDQFERDGRVWLRNAISENDLAHFDAAAAKQLKAGKRLGPSEALGHAISTDSTLMQAVRRLDPQTKPVRVVAFNKTEDAN